MVGKYDCGYCEEADPLVAAVLEKFGVEKTFESLRLYCDAAANIAVKRCEWAMQNNYENAGMEFCKHAANQEDPETAKAVEDLFAKSDLYSISRAGEKFCDTRANDKRRNAYTQIVFRDAAETFQNICMNWDNDEDE